MDRSYFSDYDTVALWWMALSAHSFLPEEHKKEELFEKTKGPFEDETSEAEVPVGAGTGTKES